ncbi:hypothetical protein X777_16467 [Ooceraea biroi]|uniref:Uncharacterized protein n=1 Tax=Ooceraea biroi TaxID=2015173 RepID=A0A026VU84_OOCBI|nr:hypothetical protein X777_16467 [Ooceraea biroi]
MATLQGSFLLSSDRGAIRIEYAKSKMAEVGFTNLWIEVACILCLLWSSTMPLHVRETLGGPFYSRAASVINDEYVGLCFR